MDKILYALERRIPCPVVSLGASESFVLAQETLLSYHKFMAHAEAKVANRGTKRGQEHRGIRFPNLKARDELADALKRINIIGYNLTIFDDHSGQLTEKVLQHYHIRPTYTYEAYIRRVIMFSQKAKFEQMLKGKKIIVICGYADEVAKALNRNLKRSLGFTIVDAIKIHEYEEIQKVKREIQVLDFDLALLAAGMNAIILASYIANVKGKVAFDIGQGMESLITGQIIDENGFLSKTIGIVNLLKM
jgi:hypothetical protein